MRKVFTTINYLLLLLNGFFLISTASVCFAKEETQLPQRQSSNMAESVLLDNGNTLYFFSDSPEDSKIKSTLVVEKGHKERISAIELLEAEFGDDVTPEEIYHAFTLDDVAFDTLPDRSADRQRGWGIKILRKTETKRLKQAESIQASTIALSNDLACNNDSFKNFYNWALRSATPNYVRLDKMPATFTGFTDDCYNPAANGQCWGEPRYKLVKRVLTDQWGGAICGKAIQNNFYPHNHNVCAEGHGCWYRAPSVAFYYYKNGWQIMKTASGAFAMFDFPANQSRQYRFKWNTSQPTSHDIEIRYAMPNDQFDLMVDWK